MFAARTGRGDRHGMIYVAPSLLLMVILLYGPAVAGLYQSFHLFGGARDGAFVGLANYYAVLGEPGFGQVLWSTFVFVAGSVVLTVATGLFVALAINGQSEKVARILQVAVILPWAISSVVGALLFKWFYVSDLGVFLEVMRRLGLEIENPAMSSTGAMAVLIASAVWKKLGFAVILLLSGLKAIPQDFFEAARVDGANGVQRFWELTLPLIKGPLLICAVVLGVADLNTVELPLIITGGGPLDSTSTVAFSIYQKAFSQYDLQRAVTLAVLTFIVNLVLIALYVRAVRSKA